MKIKDITFKRNICAKAFNLGFKEVGEHLGMSAPAARDLLTEVLEPKEHLRIFKLAIMLNVPWQVILKERPIEESFKTYMEYYIDGAAKWIKVEDINSESKEVKSISGYVIQNPSNLFEDEPEKITGRWVKSYHDYEYFEFHLTRNPVFDEPLIKNILKFFPSTKAVITTFTPLRRNIRSLWVVFDRTPNGYKKLWAELKHRDRTILHWKAT